MGITLVCSCGKRLKARDEDAGKKAKCPGCGTVMVIEAVVILDEDERIVPNFEAITLDIGNMRSSGSYLSLSLKIEQNGDSTVRMYVSDMNSRRQGEFIQFRPNEFPEYLALIEKMCSTIRSLQRTGKMSKMIDG